MTRNLLAFTVAAVLEIAGCFAFWTWLRQGREWPVALLGIASLVGFAVVLTKVDAPFAGRAYAAYGGVYIASSLVWLLVVEGQGPTVSDTAGALLAIAGAVIIVGFATARPQLGLRLRSRFDKATTAPARSVILGLRTSTGRGHFEFAFRSRLAFDGDRNAMNR